MHKKSGTKFISIPNILGINYTISNIESIIRLISSLPWYSKYVRKEQYNITSRISAIEMNDRIVTQSKILLKNSERSSFVEFGDSIPVNVFYILFHEKYNIDVIEDCTDSFSLFYGAPCDGYYTRVLDHTNCVVAHMHREDRGNRTLDHIITMYFIGTNCNEYYDKIIRMGWKLKRKLEKYRKSYYNNINMRGIVVSQSYDKGGEFSRIIYPKTMNQLIIDVSIKKKVLNEIYCFVKSKDFYFMHKIPYKLGILIYGEPGTGKSSFARALAIKLSQNLMIVSKADIISKKYAPNGAFITSSNINRIILIEEIDEIINSDSIVSDEETNISTKIRKTDLLEYIDYAPNGVIIVATTNNYHKFLENHDVNQNESNRYDPAIIRPGRFDIKFEMKLFDRDDALKMIRMYQLTEEEVLPQIQGFPISPAELQFICMQTITQKSLKEQLLP